MSAESSFSPVNSACIEKGFVLLEVLVAMSLILGSWMTALQAYQNIAMRQQQLLAQKAEFRKQADDFEHKEYLRNQIREGARLESTRMSRRTTSINRTTQSIVKNNH